MSDDQNHGLNPPDNAYTGKPPSYPITPSPSEAQAIVDQTIRNIGVDPQKVTDPEGWRHLGLGTTHGLINVIEWEPGFYALVVWSPILQAPNDMRLRTQLFETLLQLNHHETDMARFSLMGDQIVLSFVRSIRGLNTQEVLNAIQMVMLTADALGERLQNAFEIHMPRIDMDDATWQGVLNLLRPCNAHTQTIFTRLMEGWAARKGIVAAGKSGVGLCSKSAGGKTIAGLIAFASAGPLVTVGWDSLERVWGVRPKDATAFKQAVPRPKRFKTTKSSAHLPVDDSFTEEMADQLLDALAFLEKALKCAVPPKPKPLPDLEKAWGLKLKTGGATQRNIHALLMACPPSTQEVYAKLIQGWYNAGQKIYTNKPDRVYLRLTVDEHIFALCTLYGPQKKRKPRIELRYPLLYYFDDYPEARRRYEQTISRIPGFSVHNSGARIPMGEEFTIKETEILLKILRRLAEDVSSGV